MTETRTGDVEPTWRALVDDWYQRGWIDDTAAHPILTEFRAVAREARRLALAEGLDVERLAEAMVTVMPAFYRGFDNESVREATVDAGAIAAEYARLSEEARKP